VSYTCGQLYQYHGGNSTHFRPCKSNVAAKFSINGLNGEISHTPRVLLELCRDGNDHKSDNSINDVVTMIVIAANAEEACQVNHVYGPIIVSLQ